MSQDPQPTPEPSAPPPEVVEEKPIPFTEAEALRYKATSAPVESPQTSYDDCLAVKGHGGPKGKRVYYPSGPKLGPLLDEPRICEICGRIGV